MRHPREKWLLEISNTCSTPFGITEFGTTTRTRIRRLSGCAQRLSASLNSAQENTAAKRISALLCSTPFGITEFGTDQGVLQIFHGFCAQRLSASLNSAQANHARNFHCSVRAQRLSASLNSAPRTPRGFCPGRYTCSTPFGITEFGTRPVI